VQPTIKAAYQRADQEREQPGQEYRQQQRAEADEERKDPVQHGEAEEHGAEREEGDAQGIPIRGRVGRGRHCSLTVEASRGPDEWPTLTIPHRLVLTAADGRYSDRERRPDRRMIDCGAALPHIRGACRPI
jgi:hypothetical protein